MLRIDAYVTTRRRWSREILARFKSFATDRSDSDEKEESTSPCALGFFRGTEAFTTQHRPAVLDWEGESVRVVLSSRRRISRSIFRPYNDRNAVKNLYRAKLA